MRNIFAFGIGSLFGMGLLISGMTNTVKVQGWLDIFGNWDPTLAFVLGGGIIPMAVAWRIANRRKVSVLGTAMLAPPETKIDTKLVLGSFLFGAGWALAGLCPGPAIASLGFGDIGGLVFMAAMVVGMLVVVPINSRLQSIGAS